MKSLIFSILLFINSSLAFSQWTQVDLFTGDIRDIDAGDSLIFTSAGAASLYKTTNPDSGWTYWDPLAIMPPYISHADVRNSIIFCGGAMNEFYRSVDNGNTWSSVVFNPGYSFIVNDICIGDSFVFSLTNYGLFRSPDTGNTWQACNDPLAAYLMEKLYNDGDVLYILSVDSGLYRSTNNGMSWQTVNNGFYPSCMVKSLVRKGTILILGTFCGYVYKSTDNGITWNMTGMGTGSPINCMTVSGNSLYAGTYAGVFESVNDGYSWTNISNGISHSPVVCIESWGNNILAGTPGGVYLYTAGNNIWERVCKGIYGGSFLRFTNSNGPVFTFDNLAGVFFSEDHGSTWNIKNSGLSGYDLYMLESNGTDVFAGSDFGMFKSSSAAPGWTSVQGGLPVSVPRYLIFSNNNLYASLNNGTVYKSTNAGTTWNWSSQGLPTTVGAPPISISGNNLYSIINTDLYSSLNNGNNWNYQASVPNLAYFSFFDACPNSLMAITGNTSIIVSTDSGQTWALRTFPVPPNIVYINDLLVVGNNYYVSTNKGIFFSDDDGISWTDISAGLPVANTQAIGYDGTYLFVTTDIHGTFRMPADQVTFIKGQTNKKPWAVYPNPASDFINFTGIDMAERIQIFDLYGRLEVEYKTSGSKTFTIPVSKLKNGLYLLKINGQFIEYLSIQN